MPGWKYKFNKESELQQDLLSKEQAYGWEMWAQTNQWNLDQWNRQNSYNEGFYNQYLSPQAQMRQAMAAGINPNTAAGGVNLGSYTSASSPLQASQGNSPSAPSAPDPQDNTGAIISSMVGLVDTITNAYKDLQMLPFDKESSAASAGASRAAAAYYGSQKTGQDIQNWNDAMYTGREREKGLEATDVDIDLKKATKEYTEKQGKAVDEQIRKLHWEGKTAEAAYQFTKDYNDWVLNVKNPKEIESMNAAIKESLSVSNAQNANAALAAQNARNAQTEGEILDQQKEHNSKMMPELEKQAQSQSEAVVDATNQQKFDNTLRKHGVDPNSYGSERVMQSSMMLNHEVMNDPNASAGKKAVAGVIGFVQFTTDYALKNCPSLITDAAGTKTTTTSTSNRTINTVKASAPSVRNP